MIQAMLAGRCHPGHPRPFSLERLTDFLRTTHQRRQPIPLRQLKQTLVTPIAAILTPIAAIAVHGNPPRLFFD
ncbi:MAG: hypothetical protein NTY42_02530 [Planctomycetota bacterium]|nr:hypothetical protein [Planctomycetota bacterium]